VAVLTTEEIILPLKIQKISKFTPQHYTLLLDADPSLTSIATYLSRSTAFELTDGTQSIGIIVVMPTAPQTLEIMNLAVQPAFQGHHLGQRLLQFIIDWSSSHPDFQKLTIMTGSTSFKQLALYQKLDFRCVRILQDHFVNPKLYPEPIFENQLPLRDAIVLEKIL
jgi:ribosomal protein S18 acetylase RimI-like enzyme